MTPTVVVIGAVNMDICGRPQTKPNLRDSNPGEISMSVGGVGRNIAHNLLLLGLNVRFLTAVGTDYYGECLWDDCISTGFDMSLSCRVHGKKSSSYLYVTDENGEMLLGVCDADISEELCPAYLEEKLGELNAADAVVIDGNLPEATVAWIAENVTAPLYADPVSTKKAPRLFPVLGKLAAFKPNELEALAMTGENTPLRAAEKLCDMGVKRVFVSLAENGIVAVSDEEIIKLPTECREIVNVTGAGDAAAAAIVWCGVYGLSLAETAAAASRAAAIALECPESINPGLSAEKIV